MTAQTVVHGDEGTDIFGEMGDGAIGLAERIGGPSGRAAKSSIWPSCRRFRKDVHRRGVEASPCMKIRTAWIPLFQNIIYGFGKTRRGAKPPMPVKVALR